MFKKRINFVKVKKVFCPKCAYTAHRHVYLFCFKIIWRNIYFSLICTSLGIRGNTKVQYFRDSRKLRVPSDKETAQRRFNLAAALLGKREKPKVWHVQQSNPAQELSAPLAVQGNQRAFFHCTSSTSMVSLTPAAVKGLQSQPRDQIYGLSTFTGLQEHPGGDFWDNSPALRRGMRSRRECQA